MDGTTICEQLFFLTTHIEAIAPHGTWSGTGFIYSVETDGGITPFVITNRHVLEEADAIKLTMVGHEDGVAGGVPALGKAAHVHIPLTLGSWSGHPDPDIDVAAVPFGPAYHSMTTAGIVPFFKYVGSDICLTPERARLLDAIEQIIFLGYPSGLFDSKNLTPVARRGMTATPVELDYEGKPVFLVDASVFPGSSGSPVFLLDRGVISSRDGSSVLGSRLMFLGVLAAMKCRPVEGRIIELPTRLAIVTQEAIDLGVVYKAWTIDECVDPILARAGLSRTLVTTTATASTAA
jgi:hypothetical protein